MPDAADFLLWTCMPGVWRRSIDIPYYVMNFKEEFKKYVIDYFVDEYKCGRTPNPCIACNRYVKWESLLTRCMAIGGDYIATGHYARIIQLPNGRYTLQEARGIEKDQTYALYNLTQEQLARTLMPVGEYSKPEIRKIAEDPQTYGGLTSRIARIYALCQMEITPVILRMKQDLRRFREIL